MIEKMLVEEEEGDARFGIMRRCEEMSELKRI